MDITYLGHSSFRIHGKSVSWVTDPYASSIVGLKFPKVEAQIVTISHDHDDHNKAGIVGDSPYIVSGPGEYEVKGVSIFGIPTYHDNKQGAERGPNTVYVASLDGIILCHLGDLGHKLSGETIGQIGAVDILFVPVGGFYTIDASTASEVVSSLEPKIVIPMHYKTEGLAPALGDKLAPVDDFVKEVGMVPVKTNKFVVTYDQLPEETQLIVLERRA